MAALFLFCAEVGAERAFVVLGKSEGERPNLEEALKDGLRKGIEAALEEMIPPEHLKELGGELEAEIYEKVDSFIVSYSIVEAGEVEGAYQVSLQVVVDTRALSERLSALGLKPGGKGEAEGEREVEVVVSGIYDYDTYKGVEEVLAQISGVDGFVPSEITPPIFTWRVQVKGEVERLAEALCALEVAGVKGKVKKVHAQRVEVVFGK